MMIDLEAQFNKKCEEAKGSLERMKYYAQKWVQAHNEAEKRKTLGHPSIDPKMTAKKRKKSVEAELQAQTQDRPSIVFPASITGLRPKVPSAASEQKKTRQAEAEAWKRKLHDASDVAPSKKKLKTKASRSS